MLSVSAWSQQAAMYGQYLFNKTVINPAHAGIEDINQAGILYRHQWVGVEGAPRTTSGFFTTRMPFGLGIAGAIYNDQVGPINDLTFQADIAGHIRLSQDWHGSMGLRFNGRMLSAKLSELSLNQGSDPNFSNYASQMLVNMGVGFSAYTSKAFVGLSLPTIFTQEAKFKDQPFLSFERHAFVYGGYNFKLSENYKFQPSTLVKFVSDAPIQFDINAMVQYNNTFDFGVMLRSGDAIGALVGFNLDKYWYFGYMYEYPINAVRQFTIQSHEISLRYRWKSKYRTRIESPRYFL